MRILNEDIFDDVPEVEVTDLEVTNYNEQPSGEDLGTSIYIIDCINNEWNSIQQLEQLVPNMSDEDSIEVINQIVSDKHTTVGKLQSLLKKLNPNVENIESGEQFTDVQIGNEETPERGYEYED